MQARTRSFILQYANSIAGAWANVGAVGSGKTWVFKTNAGVSDGDNIGSVLLSDSNVKGSYRQSNTSVLNPLAATTNQKIEWDYSLDPVNASWGTTYYFRMIWSDGSALASYTRFAVLIKGNLGGVTTPTGGGSGGGTPRSEGTESAPGGSIPTDGGDGGGTPHDEGPPGGSSPPSP